MSRRHDSTSDDPSSLGLLRTGPVVVRGMGRGVRGATPSRTSRHRAGDGPAGARAGRGLDAGVAAAQNPLERETGGAERDGGRTAADERFSGPAPEEEQDVASRTSDGSADDGAGPAKAPPSAAGAKTPRSGVRRTAAEARREVEAASLETESCGTPVPVSAAAAAAGRCAGEDEPALHQEAESQRGSGEAGAADGRVVLERRAPRRSTLVPGLGDRIGREAVGAAVLVVLAIVCAVLIAAVAVKSRDDAAAAAREAAAYTPPPLAGTATTAGQGAVVVIADEAALRSAAGVDAADRWPRLLAEAVGAEVTTLARAGTGYTTAGTGGRTFVETAARVSSRAEVVVFVGGAADEQTSSLSLAKAATEAYSAAAERASTAEVVAVGPLLTSGGTAAELTEVRSTLRTSSRIAGVRWIDPIAAGWIPDVSGAGSLTAADERTIAARLAVVVRAARG